MRGDSSRRSFLFAFEPRVVFLRIEADPTRLSRRGSTLSVPKCGFASVEGRHPPVLEKGHGRFVVLGDRHCSHRTWGVLIL